jgi:hypothetical protein
MPARDLLPRKGPVPKPLVLSYVRDLDSNDMLRLATLPRVPTAVPTLQRIRAQHHRIAQYLAMGKTSGQVAIIVGSTTQRISQLERDPTFQELMSYYQEQMADTNIEAGQRIQGALVEITEFSVTEIRDRLANDALRAAMSTDELRKLAEMGGDRTVAPPKTAQRSEQMPTQITFNIGGPRTLPQPSVVIEHEPQKEEVDE